MTEREIAGAAPADAAGQAPEEVHGYFATVEFKDVAVRVLVNDWPVVERDKSGNQSVLLNPFVVEGRNVVRVLVGPIPQVTSHYVYLDLERAEPGAPREDKKLLYSIRWTPFVGGVSRSEWFEVARHELFVRKGFGRWRWEDAPPFRIEDEPAARAKVGMLRDAIARNDVDGFLSLSSLKLEELARATGRHVAAVTEVQRELLKRLLSDPGVGLRRVDLDDVVFASGAGGRLIAARMPDGSAPITIEAQGADIELGVVLSRVGTDLELVR